MMPPWHALHYIPRNADSLLDIGCNVGEALLAAHQLGVRQLSGIELNPRAVELARERLSAIPGSRVFHGSADAIPVTAESFDVALACEVLEHIPDGLRPAVVREVHRVLRGGARWVITVPARGAFAFLDPANVRLQFPRVFAELSRALGGRGREHGYAGQKHGIVWHEHFRLSELRALLAPHFEIEHVRFRGMLLTPLSAWLEFPFHRLGTGRAVLRTLAWIKSCEMAIPAPEQLAYNVLVVARRKPN